MQLRFNSVVFVVRGESLSSRCKRKGVINRRRGGLSISRDVVTRKVLPEQNTEIKQQPTEAGDCLSCKTKPPRSRGEGVGTGVGVTEGQVSLSARSELRGAAWVARLAGHLHSPIPPLAAGLRLLPGRALAAFVPASVVGRSRRVKQKLSSGLGNPAALRSSRPPKMPVRAIPLF